MDTSLFPRYLEGLGIHLIIWVYLSIECLHRSTRPNGHFNRECDVKPLRLYRSQTQVLHPFTNYKWLLVFSMGLYIWVEF